MMATWIESPLARCLLGPIARISDAHTNCIQFGTDGIDRPYSHQRRLALQSAGQSAQAPQGLIERAGKRMGFGHPVEGTQPFPCSVDIIQRAVPGKHRHPFQNGPVVRFDQVLAV